MLSKHLEYKKFFKFESVTLIVEKKFTALDLLQNETRLGIILSLMIYESLNLRKIALIANIKEPSAYEHVKSLLEDEIIELDSSQANKRGKYYKLTPKSVEMIETLDVVDISKAKQNIREEFPLITAAITTPTIILKNFATYFSNYIRMKLQPENEISKSEMQQNEKEVLNLIDTMQGSFQVLEIKRQETMKSVKRILRESSEEIVKLSKEDESVKDKDLDERFLVFTFAIPLKAISPNKE